MLTSIHHTAFTTVACVRQDNTGDHLQKDVFNYLEAIEHNIDFFVISMMQIKCACFHDVNDYVKFDRFLWSAVEGTWKYYRTLFK